MTSVPSKLCSCARAHKLRRLCTRINLLRTDILLLIINKITIIRQTINFSGTKTASIQTEDLFLAFTKFRTKNALFWVKTFVFGLLLISDTKTALILGEFPEKVRTCQNFCTQKAQKIRGNIGSDQAHM